MKLIITLLITFISINGICQNNAKVIYDVYFQGNFINNNKENQEAKNYSSGVEENINKVKFQLLINNEVSIFKSIPRIKSEDENYGEKLARLFAGEDEVFYRDNSKKTIINSLEHEGVKYNLDLNFENIKWNLTTESKIIQNLTCYKATWKYRNIDVIAWYCPSIPLSTGPREFGGLPGLIIELYRGKLSFIATKIELNVSENKEVTLPLGKKISENELNIILQQSMENLKNR